MEVIIRGKEVWYSLVLIFTYDCGSRFVCISLLCLTEEWGMLLWQKLPTNFVYTKFNIKYLAPKISC